MVIEGGNEGKNRGSGVGGERHVAEVDFVERGLAHAEYKRTALFERDVGGALDEVGGDPLAMRASVPTLHGMTTMASEGYDPLAMLAPISVLDWA